MPCTLPLTSLLGHCGGFPKSHFTWFLAVGVSKKMSAEGGAKRCGLSPLRHRVGREDVMYCKQGSISSGDRENLFAVLS